MFGVKSSECCLCSGMRRALLLDVSVSFGRCVQKFKIEKNTPKIFFKLRRPDWFLYYRHNYRYILNTVK